MEDEVLSTKIVEPLLKITESSYRLFKDLCICEQNGKKNDSEYKKKIEYLLMVKEEEELFYLNMSKNVGMCRETIFYIINKKIPNTIFRDFDSIFIDKHDFASVRRVVNSLNDIISSSVVSFQQIPFLTDEDNRKMLNSYLNFNYLLNALQNDLINTFLYNLSERIKTESNKKIRDLLIKAKYYTSFIFPGTNLEIVFNDNNKGISRITDCLLEYCNDYDDNYSKIKKSFLVRNAKQYIMKMMLINKCDNSANYIIHEEMIRSFIELMSLDEISEVYNYFNYFSSNKNINIGVIQAIDNIFTSISDDKTKIISIKM